MEAILLAGGLGTRLHEVTGDRYPKSLAKIDGRPFLHYVVKYLESMGVTRFVFAISHHAQMIIDDITEAFPDLEAAYSIEEQPLGTGGAIKQAMAEVRGEQVIVVNSDSFMEFSLAELVAFAKQNKAPLSIVCTEVDDVSRFGAADIAENGVLNKFFEKGRKGPGYINSGIYLIKKSHPLLHALTGRFSFENDILSNKDEAVYAMKTRGLFFDIGTPDDFKGAQRLVANHGHLFLQNPDRMTQ
jgi:D-glycero-alpha-D-manno-heptose 1-phosphate guanylyltransferase